MSSRRDRVPAFLALIVLAVSFGSLVSCERTGHVVRRPWAEAPELEPVTLAGTTMPARRLTLDGRSVSVALGEVVPGDLLLAAAVEGPADARVAITIEGEEGPGCTVAAAGEKARWADCRLPIARAARAAKLRLDPGGTSGIEVVVSSPYLHPTASVARPPVFVVLTDTLRFDHLKTYAKDVPLGTHLDELARDGIVFERAYSSSSWTRPAVATLLTGLYAATHGVAGRTDSLARERERLARALQRAGYRTYAWSTNPNILPLWGFDAGFDVFHDVGAWKWPEQKVHAGIVLDAVVESLAAAGSEPPFHYVHLMDPHDPYQPPRSDLDAVRADPALAATYPGRKRTWSAEESHRAYMAEVRRMDRELGAFFTELRRLGLYDDAAIVVVADHGEEFLDHGGVRHARTLYEEVLRVPLILKLPGNALAGTRVASEVALADVAPTLLGALGVDGLADADGRDLWDAERGRLRDEPSAPSAMLRLDDRDLVALVSGGRKLIVDHRRGEALFDLRADPRERHDLLPARRDEAVEMRLRLDERIARRASGWHVRACGGREAAAISLRISVAGELRGTSLEPGDEIVRLGEGSERSAYDVHLDLSPQRRPRERKGKLVEITECDEDELSAPSPEGSRLELSSTAGGPVRYVVGTDGALRSATEITLSSADPAVRARASEGVDCSPRASADSTSASVRIWYVPRTAQRKPEEVKEGVQERLRALGYQW